ncbi:hypothetical protein Tco_0255156 [Tanacetum coccineum]
MVDPSIAFSANDPTKLMVLVLLVDALPLSNPRPMLQLAIVIYLHTIIIVGIKRLLDDLRVTAAKLMLLVQKLLLLVLKVNAAERLQLLEEFMLTEKRSKTYQRKDKDCLKFKITYVISMSYLWNRSW